MDILLSAVIMILVSLIGCAILDKILWKTIEEFPVDNGMLVYQQHILTGKYRRLVE